MQSHGLVDLQVNGFAGVDFNTSRLDPRCFRQGARGDVRHGRDVVSADDHHGLGRRSCGPVRRARSRGRAKPARAPDGAGLSPRRAVPQSGGRLRGMPSAIRDDRAGCGPRVPARSRPVETDPPRHHRARTSRQRGLHPRHDGGRQDRGDRPFGGRCADGGDGGSRRRPHVDASGQRPAADPAQTRQHAVRATGRAEIFMPVSSSTASTCRNRPCAR